MKPKKKGPNRKRGQRRSYGAFVSPWSGQRNVELERVKREARKASAAVATPKSGLENLYDHVTSVFKRLFPKKKDAAANWTPEKQKKLADVRMVYLPREGDTWNPLVSYPRNKGCCCGSGEKFKRCCGPFIPRALPDVSVALINEHWEKILSGHVTLPRAPGAKSNKPKLTVSQKMLEEFRGQREAA